MFQSVVLPVHGHGLRRALKEITIAVEYGRDAGQNVVISAFRLSKVKMLNVDVSENDKLGIFFAGFEKLSVELDRKIMQLLLGVHGIFDFLLRLLVRIGEMLGREITATGLHV